MTTHDDLTGDAPTTVPWLLIIAYFALIAVAGLTVGDPGDRTQSDCHTSPVAVVSGSGSGFPASPVEPDPDCSQEVGR